MWSECITKVFSCTEPVSELSTQSNIGAPMRVTTVPCESLLVSSLMPSRQWADVICIKVPFTFGRVLQRHTVPKGI